VRPALPCPGAGLPVLPGNPALGALQEFLERLLGCLTARRETLLELADADLCPDRPVRSCTWRIRWGVKAYGYQRVKTDARDAANLADLLRMRRLPEAWITPREVRELRELTRYRQKLVGLRSNCKDQVHAVLAKVGIAVTCSDLFGAWGSGWLDGLRLPQPYAGR
jgi:hypothetical protein